MPFEIIKKDITTLKVGAIVNTTNTALQSAGTGVDYAIHKAAGPDLQKACDSLAPCPVGEVRVTPGFNLPCDYVIHTVGPVWQGGNDGEKALLACCYENILKQVMELGCQSVAMPLISTGHHGYPLDEAMSVAVDISRRFLEENDIFVYLVVYTRNLPVSNAEFSNAVSFGAESYRERKLARERRRKEKPLLSNANALSDIVESACICPEVTGAPAPAHYKVPDESFGQAVVRLAEKRYKKTSEFYLKANITKQTYSRLKNEAAYKPSRSTALACVVALGLELDEAEKLLKRAGFALSGSLLGDIIIQTAIEHGVTDVTELNIELFNYDQPLIGLS